MLEELGQFHFLRPIWLLLLAPAAILYWLIRIREDPRRPWRGIIAPHLLEHLLVDRRTAWRLRPIHLVCAALAISAIAISGPTWQREPTPFTEDTAPLVIAVDLSESMDAIDLQPTRLERAKQKIRDLLALRSGARTALIAFAGTSHRILPLTDDPSLLELFLASLSTDLMPVQGRKSGDALKLAEEILAKETTPGSILFVTSGIDRSDFPDFLQHKTTSRNSVLVLAAGTAKGGPLLTRDNRFRSNAVGSRIISQMNVDDLKSLQAQDGAEITSISLDSTDVEWLQRRIQSHLVAARQDDPQARWKDFGYYLAFPVGLLAALWFRKGWTVRWAPAIVMVFTFGDAPACKAEFRFLDFWLTPDQQGRYYFERGDYPKAAERFEDPMWKGIAAYRAGKFDNAVIEFAQIESAQGYFHLGNTYAKLGKFPDAVQSYQQALKLRSDFTEARYNMALVSSLIPRKKKDDQEGEEAPDLPPDQVKFEKGDKGKRTQVVLPRFDPKKMAEIWMRSIQTTPADFLREKFRLQAEKLQQ